MTVTIIPIVIGAFDTVTKGLLKELEDLQVGGWVETIQTTELLRTARILGRVLETWEDLLSLHADVKNSKEVKNNNNRYDCMGKVIHWELGKKLKLYHTNK